MKRTIALILSFSLLTQNATSQLNNGLVELGKAYRQFMFRNNPPEEFLKTLDKYDSTELKYTAKFIKEAIKENNNLLQKDFLNRPSDSDLKLLFIVAQINYNIRKDNPKDNNEIINEFLNKNILTEELIDNYYSMLIVCYGNKVRPFDMSAVNFDLNSFGLKNDTEKGIFFLEVMRLCGSQIWGYINIPKPPKYNLALEYISKFPKFNYMPYYQFLDLNFPDFKINIESEDKAQSYKEYYIDKYYETLLNNLMCLKETNQSEEKINNLLLGSLLKEEAFYKYSKNEKQLKKLFKKIKN